MTLVPLQTVCFNAVRTNCMPLTVTAVRELVLKRPEFPNHFRHLAKHEIDLRVRASLESLIKKGLLVAVVVEGKPRTYTVPSVGGSAGGA